jgi:hypothetical protein
MSDSRPSSISQPAAGMLVGAYVCMLFAVAWGLVPDYGSGDPSAQSVLAAQLSHPLLWAALVLSWSADVLISRRGELVPGGRGITVGQLRFFHGPLVTVVCAASIVMGILGALG